jgi:hypothetical protein
MGNISELDIRIGMIINTPHGEGCIESVDRRANIVKVAIESDIRNLESFKIEDLSIKIGQIHPSITQEIGDIAIISSRIEQRLKDFLSYVLNLKNYKQRILIIREYSIIRCLEKINEILNDCYPLGGEKISQWKSIYNELKEIIEVRNNVIHGSIYPTINDEYLFSNRKKIKNTKLDPDKQIFTYKKLRKITEQIYDTYYKNMFFLNSVCDEIKVYLNKSDQEFIRPQ